MKGFIFFILIFFPLVSFSAKFCSTSEPEYYVQLPDDINILPGLPVGSVIAASEDIKKTIHCTESQTYALLAYHDTTMAGVSVDIDNRGPCKVMTTDYPGLGIAWYNFNSGTNKWQCNSLSLNPNDIGHLRRGLAKGDTEITDAIFLIKTGEITTGYFDLNLEFEINEGYGNDPTVNNGKLYSIYLQGKKDISAPVCEVINSKNSLQYAFNTADVNTQNTHSDNIHYKITCSNGFIENGTKIPIKITAPYDKFTLDENYFATSVDGLGLSLSYTNGASSDRIPIRPETIVMLPVNNNEAEMNIQISPYFMPDSGVYPLISDAVFDLNIAVSE